MKIRFHRGGIVEAMETMFEPKDWEDFCKHCEEENEYIITDSISCRHYSGADNRIGWKDTWIILAQFKGDINNSNYPIGFADENVLDLKGKIRNTDKKMKNFEKYIKEIAHDILCADSESNSDIVSVLPKELQQLLEYSTFDTSYDDERLVKLVEWLQSEAE